MPENLTPPVLGTIDEQTAAAWGELGQVPNDLSAEAAKIQHLTEFGRIAVEAGEPPRGVVLVTNGEEGAVTGRVVNFGEQLGDHLRGYVGVSSEQGDELSVLKVPEKTDDFLTPGALHGKVKEVIDNKPSMKESLNREILGPEQAVLLGHQTTEEFGTKLGADVEQLSQNVLSLNDGSVIESNLRTISDALPEINSSLYALMDVIDNGQPLDEYHFTLLARLDQFGKDYLQLIAPISSALEDSNSSIRNIVDRAEQLLTDLRSGRNKLEGVIDESFAGAIRPELEPELIEAVEQRGATTVNQHREQATQEVNGQFESIDDAVGAVHDLNNVLNDLSYRVRSELNNFDEIPKNFNNLIDDLVGEITRNGYRTGSNRYASETLQSIAASVLTIERALPIYNPESSHVSMVAKTRDAINTLKQSSIFVG
jgi:hypothetical protein